MELFLLIAIGIAVISFISIALTKPSSPILQESPESVTDGPVFQEETMLLDSVSEQNSLFSEAEQHQQIEEETMVPMA